MNKRNLVMSILLGSILIAGVFSTTYAYFGVTQTNTTSNQVVVTTGGVTIVLDDVDPISQEDKIDANNTSITRYLKITNESVQDAYINVLFKDLVNTFVLDDLTYTLEEVQSDKSSFDDKRILIDKEVVPKSSTVANTALARGVLINKGTQSTTVTPHIQYYKLTVNYNYRDDVNQDVDLNKVLTSGFIIEEGSPERVTLTFNIGEDATIESNTMDAIYTSTYSNLPTPVKSGKKFGGWYLDAAYTNKVTSSSLVSSNDKQLYAKWNDPNSIYCVNDEGAEVTCPDNLQYGQRVAVGRDSGVQYFRYLRTTSTTSNLNDCGNANEYKIEECGDPENNKLRLIGEYNLKRISYTQTDNYQVTDGTNGNDSIKWTSQNLRGDQNYVSSYIKKHVDNYANALNTKYYSGASILSADVITIFEVRSLFGCGTSNTAACSSIPTWLHITSSKEYSWTRSSAGSNRAYYIHTEGISYGDKFIEYNYSYAFTRPIIMIDKAKLYE